MGPELVQLALFEVSSPLLMVDETIRGACALSGEVVLAFDENVVADRTGCPGLEMGAIAGVVHERLGGLPRRPLDDDAKRDVLA